MALKVLIVDDDPLFRTYLRSLIDWETNGFYICGEAVDGNDAIEKILEFHPEIVTVDAFMPRFDGITLSKEINEKYTDIQIIMLSSYDNYDYVRETMRNGAVDYLLKHRIDELSLLNTLNKLKQKFVEKAQKSENEKRQIKDWEVVSPMLIEGYIKDLILRNDCKKELISDYFERLNLYCRSTSMVIMVIQIKYFDIVTYNNKDDEKNFLIRNILDICRQVVAEYKEGCTVYIDQGRIVVLLAFEGLKSENDIFKRAQEYRTSIENSLKLFLNLDIIFGKSPVCTMLLEIGKYYEMAFRNMCEMRDSVLSEDILKDKKPGLNKFISLTISQERQVLSAIESGNHCRINLIIDEIFQTLRIGENDFKNVQIIITELLEIAHKVSIKAGIELDRVVNNKNIEEWSQYKTLDDIKFKINVLYNKIVDEIQRHGKPLGCSKYVTEGVEYINTNFKDDVSLESAAKSIGIASNYLSKLFKEETGITFTEYLNNIRIDVSKKYIDGGMRVNEIYNCVGFKNYSYFFKVFKKIVKSTPMEYVNRNTKD